MLQWKVLLSNKLNYLAIQTKEVRQKNKISSYLGSKFEFFFFGICLIQTIARKFSTSWRHTLDASFVRLFTVRPEFHKEQSSQKSKITIPWHTAVTS